MNTGTYVYGRGFVLSDAERERFVELDPRNSLLIKPYLKGEDVTTVPCHAARSWVIDFGDLSEAEAKKWPLLFEHLVTTVKPERAKQTKQVHEASFWKHWDKREELYVQLKQLEDCIVHAFLGKFVAFAVVPSNQIIATPCTVFPTSSRGVFAVLQSSIHTHWVSVKCSMMGGSMVYASSDLVLPFPFPENLESLDAIGSEYENYRLRLMIEFNEGMTNIYNRFHDRDVSHHGIDRMRKLAVEMDQAVLLAYDWRDIEMHHGFYATKQGIRFTVDDASRREFLRRLLELNQERYAEEVKQGLHEKKKSGKKRVASDEKKTRKVSAKKNSATMSFLDDEEG